MPMACPTLRTDGSAITGRRSRIRSQHASASTTQSRSPVLSWRTHVRPRYERCSSNSTSRPSAQSAALSIGQPGEHRVEARSVRDELARRRAHGGPCGEVVAHRQPERRAVFAHELGRGERERETRERVRSASARSDELLDAETEGRVVLADQRKSAAAPPAAPSRSTPRRRVVVHLGGRALERTCGRSPRNSPERDSTQARPSPLGSSREPCGTESSVATRWIVLRCFAVSVAGKTSSSSSAAARETKLATERRGHELARAAESTDGGSSRLSQWPNASRTDCARASSPSASTLFVRGGSACHAFRATCHDPTTSVCYSAALSNLGVQGTTGGNQRNGEAEAGGGL